MSRPPFQARREHPPPGELPTVLRAVVLIVTLMLCACGPAPTATGRATRADENGATGGGPAAAVPSRCATSAPLVIAATATSAEPSPALSANARRELAEAGGRKDACADVVLGDGAAGSIATYPLTPFRANGQPERGSRRAERLADNVRELEAALPRLGARVPGLDTLGLMTAVGRRYSTPGTLYLISSGVSTVEPLDLRQVGWDLASELEVSALKAGGWLPPLAGWRVVLIGVGDTAGSQPRLTPPLRSRIVSLWTAICWATGAASCTVDPQLVSGSPPTASNNVPVVPLPAVARSSALVSIPAALLFAIDSAVIDSAGDAVLRELLAQAQGRRLSITGRADASTGSAAHNTRLSLQRAEAVARRLIQLGLPAGQIAAVSGLGSAGYSAAEERRHPELVSRHRTVDVTF